MKGWNWKNIWYHFGEYASEAQIDRALEVVEEMKGLKLLKDRMLELRFVLSEKYGVKGMPLKQSYKEREEE